MKITFNVEEASEEQAILIAERLREVLSEYNNEEETETVEFDEEVMAEMITNKLLGIDDDDKPIKYVLTKDVGFIANISLQDFVEKILQLEDEVLDELFGDEE